MASQHAVADIRSESFPEYEGKIQDLYVEGYDPVSYSAPHSSLLRYSTWVAMGLILASLFGMGLAIWGATVGTYGYGASAEVSSQLILYGLGEAVVTLVLGAFLIVKGRAAYRQYREQTGRVN
ncbi:hypothetical protein ACXIUA_10275 [Corynebacterium sp. UMB8791]